ncbi:MAG: hypothetical protein QGH15_16025 [Kiritimatiellia bacterium]|nr:hypothetical protein [Kiritimatiellia bacterium]
MSDMRCHSPERAAGHLPKMPAANMKNLPWLMLFLTAGAALKASAALVAQYEFESDATNSAKYELRGTAQLVNDPGGGGKGQSGALRLKKGDSILCKPVDLALTNNITVAFWINPVVCAKYETIMSQKGSWRIGKGPHPLKVLFSVEGHNPEGEAPGLELGKGWHHVAVVHASESGQYMYVDGVLTDSRNLHNSPALRKGGSLEIGGFDGLVDSVRVYNHAMSKEEIAGLSVRYFAWDHNPAHETDHVDPNTSVSWKPGVNAVSHDVYMGTDSEEVRNASIASSTFRGNQKGTGYDPDDLEYGGNTYYWRVDEICKDGKTLKGGVMRFTTWMHAFPGAEGSGAYTRGGRGGKVLFVTNLKDYDPGTEEPLPGSLRAACYAKGPRTVVFRVSGTIELVRSIHIKEPYLTIAGQTAPGGGICIKGPTMPAPWKPPFLVGTREVIIRYMRFRPGDENAAANYEKDNHCYNEHDALTVDQRYERPRQTVRNVIIDHCSLSWSMDETFAGGCPALTMQWCIISESLHRSYHPSRGHGFGCLFSGSLHHCLLAHHYNRAPNMGNGDFRNNVVYNCRKGYGLHNLNWVGNYFKRSSRFLASGDDPRIYVKGNYMEGADEKNEQQWSMISGLSETKALDKPLPGPSITTDTAQEAYRKVLASAGASLPERDAVDYRIVKDVKEGTGKLINSVNEVGGYPELKSTPPPRDTDSDGMPDNWEKKYGFNLEDASDNIKDRDGDGYTNIEECLNGTNPGKKERDT